MAVRISAADARQRVEAGQAVLVCAYDDDNKCRDAGVTGSITHKQFLAELPRVPKTREIIFFCG
jgi:hypothetical protein